MLQHRMIHHCNIFQDIHLLDSVIKSNVLWFLWVRHCLWSIALIQCCSCKVRSLLLYLYVCVRVCRLKDHVLPAAMSLRPVVSLYILPPRTATARPPRVPVARHCVLSLFSLYARQPTRLVGFWGFRRACQHFGIAINSICLARCMRQ